MMIRQLTIFTFLFLIPLISISQFIVTNSSQNLGGGYYKLTDPINDEIGYMWHTTMHNMNNPLTVEGRFNFGTDAGGADGICFIIQDQCAGASGIAAGGGIGYFQMQGNSISIEFDTYQNIVGSGNQDNNDPSFDHIAITKMGNVDHANATNALYAPIPMNPLQLNQKDGAWHDFKITYNPSTSLIEVYYDNALRISYPYNIQTNIFNGNPYVYWGFSSSTGGKNNLQQVYIDKQKTSSALKDTTVCNTSVTVNLPPLTQFNSKNQALNKTVRVSSLEGPAPLGLAVDGDMNTRWSSQFSDPQWIRVDLGGLYDIDSVVLYWEPAYGKQYTIQYTADTNSTWTNAYTETNGDGGKDKIVAAGNNVRYVRMYGTQRATMYGYSLWEFQVYGKAKYVWSPNNGFVSDIYSNNPTFSPAGSTVTYTVSIPDACIAGIKDSFTITNNCTLPVTFLNFTLKRVDGISHLYWEPSNEGSTVNYFVERSFDGIHFLRIGNITAERTPDVHLYFYDDETFIEGNAYYRIAAVDQDNSIIYSDIRSVSDAHLKFNILPNPNDGMFVISGFADAGKEIQIYIYNTSGQTIYSNNMHAQNHFELKMDLSDFSTGMYLISIISDNEKQTQKIIKK